MTLQKVPINNFRGGLNTRDGPFDLQPNESPDLLNVTISSLVGQLETRKGKTRVDTSGMPNGTVDHAKQVVIGASGKRFLMLSIEGAIYAMAPSGEVKKLFAAAHGTAVWDFEVYSDAAGKDWVYMGNGVDAMKKWDGEAAAVVEWTATKGAIPKGGVLCVWENRMFISYVGTQVQRLYFSEFADPEATIAEYGFVDIRGSEEDLDAIQDLVVLGARLMVLKRRGVFFVSSAVTMLNRHIGGPGVWGRFMSAVLEDKLYFFNPQGIFATGGVNVTMESGSITNWFPANLNQFSYEKARLIATKDTYPRLLLSVETTAISNTWKLIEMVPHINFRRIGGRRYLLLPAFMLHTLKGSALATWNPSGSEEFIVGTDKSSSIVAFPVIAITDTFNRANENPLNNAGKWELLPFSEGTTGALKLVTKQVVGNASGTNLSVYTAAAIKEPEVTVKVSAVLGALPVPGQSQGVGLGACIKKGAEESNWEGYILRWIHSRSLAGLITDTIYLEIIKGGKLTASLLKLVGVKAPEAGDELGMTVAGGKIYVGIKPSGGKWEVLAVSEDTTFSEGKSALLLQIGEGSEGYAVQNFSQAAFVNTAAETAAAFRLFNGTTDDGEPIAAHWASAWLPIQEQEPKERIRRLNIQLSGEAEVEVFKDFEETPAFTAAIPKAEEGEPNKYRFERVRPETHGRYHQVRVKTPIGSSVGFGINAMELAVRGGKEH